MAAAGVRVKITLACTECKQRNYNTMKNKRNNPDRIEMSKYCRFCKTRAKNWIVALPGRISGAFKNMVAELKKVAWPSKKDLVNYSIVVIAFVVVLAIVVGLLDTGSSFLVKKLIEL